MRFFQLVKRNASANTISAQNSRFIQTRSLGSLPNNFSRQWLGLNGWCRIISHTGKEQLKQLKAGLRGVGKYIFRSLWGGQWRKQHNHVADTADA